MDSISQSFLKFTKNLRKFAKNILKVLVSAFLSTPSIKRSPLQNAINSVPQMILLFCFYLKKADIYFSVQFCINFRFHSTICASARVSKFEQ